MSAGVGVVGWLFDGQTYCDGCVEPAHKLPEYCEGWGSPILELDQHDDTWRGYCCGTCGHTLGCCAGYATDCFPCDRDDIADAQRAALARDLDSWR
jgi:hypothetical protein